ncbi:hypothetical protein WN943_014048 [Citrus x changshan-huyou]
MMMGGRQAHVLAIANPAQGHVGPLMKLSLLIADQGIKDGREERIQLSESMQRVMPSHLENLIMKINSSEDDRMATCFIAHATIAWALDNAKKMGVKMAMFWPSAVAAFAFKSSSEVWDDQNISKIASNEHRRVYMECSSSFYELENLACDSIPNVLPIGPLLWINRPGKAAASLWPEDSTCLKWLDKQPSQSVIYVAFGSIAIFSRCQFEEVALGLELAGRPFLWVVRPNLLDGSVIKYPDGFLERVPNQGMIIEWAPQEQVLAHRAVACFLSHCGWNSTIEGLSSAVPFLCWPYFADQFLIRSYICDFWKVGLGLKQEANGNISRHEIKRNLDQFLSDSGIRENGLQIKEMAGKSLIERESSRKNFEIFIYQLKCII